MRSAERNDVAHPQLNPRRHGHERVLIHHRRHLAGTDIVTLCRHHTSLVTQQRHRQPGVVGHVAFAQGDHCKTRFRQRLHMGPDFQRRAQAFVQIATTVEHAALRFFIDAMVVSHVAAGAQYAEETSASVLRFEGLGDQVVPGRTRRGDDRLGNGERAAVLQLHRQTHQRRGECANAGDRMITVNHAFITFDTGQCQRGLCADGLGQGDHFLFGPATATATHHAVLDHHVQAHTARGEIRAEVSDVVRVIDHAMEIERRVRQQIGDQRHVRRSHQLVGHQHPTHTMRVRRAGLRGAGQGDTPGAGVQLAAKQGRGHAGFAVRREFGAAVADERLHPANVVFQRLAVQHQRRQADVAHQMGTGLGKALFHGSSILGRRHGRTPHIFAAANSRCYSLMRRARRLALSINTRR